MKAKCIKSDPLGTLQVGKTYDLKEYPFNFAVMDGEKIVFGISKDRFKEHFELIQQ